jgi:hypothetical protein
LMFEMRFPFRLESFDAPRNQIQQLLFTPGCSRSIDK